jgi:hypothetical protein
VVPAEASASSSSRAVTAVPQFRSVATGSKVTGWK